MKIYKTIRKNRRDLEDVNSAKQEDQPILRSKEA